LISTVVVRLKSHFSPGVSPHAIGETSATKEAEKIQGTKKRLKGYKIIIRRSPIIGFNPLGPLLLSPKWPQDIGHRI
jgi:hypothetical protein